MRHRSAPIAAVLFGLMACTPGSRALGPKAAPSAHRLTTRQAEALIRLVAPYDKIDLRDTHVEVNSLDLMSPFVPGFASFILIREATMPGPDETLHRYAVNRNTGDVWEMTECTRYDFPALTQMQRGLTGHAATLAEIAAEREALGCSAPKGSSSPAAAL